MVNDFDEFKYLYFPSNRMTIKNQLTFDITHFIAVLRLIIVLVLDIKHSVYLMYFFIYFIYLY